MRAIDTRKAVRDLRQLCKKHGVELTIDPSKGPGSHRGIIFEKSEFGQPVSVVIAGHQEISPGVQRGILNYTSNLDSKLGKLSNKILAQVFNK